MKHRRLLSQKFAFEIGVLGCLGRSFAPNEAHRNEISLGLCRTDPDKNLGDQFVTKAGNIQGYSGVSIHKRALIGLDDRFHDTDPLFSPSSRFPGRG